MRTLIRYLLFFGVLVGLAFAVVSVEIGGETLYRRYRMQRLWPKATAWVESTWASLEKLAAPKKEKTKSSKRRATKAPDARAKERVAILRRATKEAAAASSTKRGSAKRKTRVDPHISSEQKKALDDLVTSRVGRR